MNLLRILYHQPATPSRQRRPRRSLNRCERLESRQLLDAGGLLDIGLQNAGLAEGEGLGNTVADVALADTNTTSGTFGQNVTLDSFPGQTTAWYFGHAT